MIISVSGWLEVYTTFRCHFRSPQ